MGESGGYDPLLPRSGRKDIAFAYSRDALAVRSVDMRVSETLFRNTRHLPWTNLSISSPMCINPGAQRCNCLLVFPGSCCSPHMLFPVARFALLVRSCSIVFVMGEHDLHIDALRR